MEKIIYHEGDKKRLDHFLVEVTSFSRSLITKSIKNGEILVNGKMVKPGFMLSMNDEITYAITEEQTYDVKPVNIPLNIVYEDEHILVINKPKGLVVHPAPSYKGDTLVSALIYHYQSLSDVNGPQRLGIVHRIDKDTSGLLMVAKTNEAHQNLAKALKNHEIQRSYYAIVHGTPNTQFGTIDAPIGRDPNYRTKNTVIKTGRHAVTHFEVVETNGKFSLLRCNLETGRTHQIRVHLQYIGYPIVGDPLYSYKRPYVDNGQMLHAYKLHYIHPITKKEMTHEVPLPLEFEEFLKLNN